MNHHYCVVLGEAGKGKSSFLNALFKNFNVDEHLDTSDEGGGCTKKIKGCKPVNIHDDKYFFIDTPGLKDKELDEQTKEALRNQATNPKNRIKAIAAHVSGVLRHKTDYRANYACVIAVDFEGAEDDNSAVNKEAKQKGFN